MKDMMVVGILKVSKREKYLHRKQLTYFEALKFMLSDASMQNKFNNSYLKILFQSLL